MTGSLPRPRDDGEWLYLYRRMLKARGDAEHECGYSQALPDRWTRLSEPALRCLLDLYRDRRETWNEDHETAVTRVLAEVDFEPDQDDLKEIEE